MAVIGIDLGTTNSLVCIYRNGRAELIPNRLGSVLTPSCVGFADDGETILVGRAAKDEALKSTVAPCRFGRVFCCHKKYIFKERI